MCGATGNGRPNAVAKQAARFAVVACRIRSARPQGSGQGWGGKRGSHLGLFMVCWGPLSVLKKKTALVIGRLVAENNAFAWKPLQCIWTEPKST